jgi:hypothetical protein
MTTSLSGSKAASMAGANRARIEWVLKRST